MPDEKLGCTVVSYVPLIIHEEKPGLYPPRYDIKASDMKIPSILHVNTADHFVYLDQDRGTLRVRNGSDVVAKSLVDDYISSQLGVDDTARPALFWTTGIHTSAEIMTAFKLRVPEMLDKQRKWFINICVIADNDWNKSHQHNVVSDFQRRLAEIIGWQPDQHEWMIPHSSLATERCPACQTPVVPGLAICPSCRCILDKTKYSKFEFAETR